MTPARLGVSGYIGPIVVITAGYALFQAANNTAVMGGVRTDQRGVVSGLLNLSRNLGLITGAAAMGAVFTLASATTDLTTAAPEAVATGNPGCLLQISSALDRCGRSLPAMHPVELLDASIRGIVPKALEALTQQSRVP